MTRHLLVLALVGCNQEHQIVDTLATLTIDAQTGPVELDAVLRYPSDAVPRRAVSDALRVTVTSSLDPEGGDLSVDFPDAEPEDLTSFSQPNALNLLGVFAPCEEETCETVSRVVLGHPDRQETLIVEADAILTARIPKGQDTASLELVLR